PAAAPRPPEWNSRSLKCAVTYWALVPFGCAGYSTKAAARRRAWPVGRFARKPHWVIPQESAAVRCLGHFGRWWTGVAGPRDSWVSSGFVEVRPPFLRAIGMIRRYVRP